MQRNNPIAETLDETIPSVLKDPKRTAIGFQEFAKWSVEYQVLQRRHYAELIEGPGSPADKLYRSVLFSLWLGFEAGKNYVIGGRVEQMLRMEDDLNREAARVEFSGEQYGKS